MTKRQKYQMVTLDNDHDVVQGYKPDAMVRRLYNRRAQLFYNHSLSVSTTDTRYYTVVTPALYGGFNVIGEVRVDELD